MLGDVRVGGGREDAVGVLRVAVGDSGRETRRGVPHGRRVGDVVEVAVDLLGLWGGIVRSWRGTRGGETSGLREVVVEVDEVVRVGLAVLDRNLRELVGGVAARTPWHLLCCGGRCSWPDVLVGRGEGVAEVERCAEELGGCLVTRCPWHTLCVRARSDWRRVAVGTPLGAAGVDGHDRRHELRSRTWHVDRRVQEGA